MAYILGISVPAQVSIGMALQRIKGISTTKAKWLCAATNVGFFLPVEQVNQYQLNELQSLLENSLITGTALNHFTNSKIKKLKLIRSYRGVRHMSGLPARGQRTHTNSKTQKRLGRNRGN